MAKKICAICEERPAEVAVTMARDGTRETLDVCAYDYQRMFHYSPDKIEGFLNGGFIIKPYIRRRLRLAYLTMPVHRSLYTTDDILSETITRAYEKLDQKPSNLTLEQWLYKIANEVLDQYIREIAYKNTSEASVETITKYELRDMKERITGDAEGKVVLFEDLDDSDYRPRDFTPPHHEDFMLKGHEREEEVLRILRALSHVPLQERIAFELLVMEGLPQETVARIMELPAENIPRLAQKAMAQVFNSI